VQNYGSADDVDASIGNSTIIKSYPVRHRWNSILSKGG
jgi:hypothetical protein